MAIFRHSGSSRYRVNLCNRNKEVSSVEFESLEDAIQRAQEALANDVLPTNIEWCIYSGSGSEWFSAWYPDDMSGVYSERKAEIAASLEDFIKSNA